MVKKISLIIICAFAISCANDKTDSKISKEITDKCPNLSSCLINFSDIIKDDWDYVLITNEQISLEELNKLLGFEYPYFSDIGSRIIFVKDNKVVYHEDEFPQAEKVLKGTLKFNLENNFLKLKKENAKFRVTEKNRYIELTIL